MRSFNMLIRAVTREDMPAWLKQAHEADDAIGKLTRNIDGFFTGFDGYMERKIKQHEAFMAADRISGRCLGIIALSKKHNSISYTGITRGEDYQATGIKLIQVALNQLDNTREITAHVLKSDDDIFLQEYILYEYFGFAESGDIIENGLRALEMSRPATPATRPGSFHHDYANYIKWQDEKHCPVCASKHKTPFDTVLIKELEYSRIESSMLAAQGLLWGKCVVICKKHYVALDEIPEKDFTGFMTDVRKAVKALKEVSGAVKINLELHANSIPHLHIHLFPRYLDDPYAGKAIDFTKIFPTPYESKAEYEYFVQQMREKLSV